MNLARDLVTEMEAMDPVLWIEHHVYHDELGRPFALFDHQKTILRTAFRFDDEGRMPYDTVIWSCPKKSGKTLINSLICLYWGMCQEAPNEIYILANDEEQASSRAFAGVCKLMRNNPEIDPNAVVMTKEIRLSNGTVIKPIASEYAGAAGSAHGLVSFDELWAYVSARSERLFEEMTSIPTRRNSVRFITTYAGWENESKLLRTLYLQGVGPDECEGGQGVRLHPELPIWHNLDSRLLVYWDHIPRMPWQRPQYYAAQKRTLRPVSYQRLHENRWALSETIFITPDIWDACVDEEHHPIVPTQRYTLFVGIDASTKHDSSAVVAVRWDGDQLALAHHRIWIPGEEGMDLEHTIEAELLYLHAHYHVQVAYADPYQLHRSIKTLQDKSVHIEEFPQTVGNTTKMGGALFDVLKGKTIRLYPNDELRAHAMNTVGVETPRGTRIAKEKSSQKIDSIIALAMAVVGALEHGNTKAESVDPDEMQRLWREADAEGEDAEWTPPPRRFGQRWMSR